MNVQYSGLILQIFWAAHTLRSPIPVAAPSREWVYGRSLAGIAGSNPTGGINACYECYVLSGRGLCTGLITRLEESYYEEALVS